MIFAAFIIGMYVGGFVGLEAMCLCVISEDESRREEQAGKDTVSESNAKTNLQR